MSLPNLMAAHPKNVFILYKTTNINLTVLLKEMSGDHLSQDMLSFGKNECPYKTS